VEQPVHIRRSGEIGIIATDNPPVNALSSAVRKGLLDAVEELDGDPAIAAIVLHCTGRTFFAGADIREFDMPPVEPALPDVINRIEAASKPVVAALHGTALGGGCEVALGCHFRVAAPAARLGLPEVKLGLLPGAGGTQRLPRRIGTARAFEFIATGNPVSAAEALEMGIVDEICDGDILEGGVAMARRAVAQDLPTVRMSEMKASWSSEQAAIEDLDRMAEPVFARRRGFPAYAAIAESIRNAVEMPFAAGLRRERELFMELKQGYQSAAQRYLFFAERAAVKIADMPPGTQPRPIERAAVLGSGTMGGGIAMCFANAGIEVAMIDPDGEALARGLSTVRSNYERSAARAGRDQKWVGERMKRIAPTADFGAVSDADIVVEAVFEDMALKKEVFKELDGLCKGGALLATNTSTLDVNVIAAATSRPQDVVGMHFFSPANVMRLLEVVRGHTTGFEALATAIETGRRLGKLPVTVGVCYGFVGNRMLHARGGQVERLLLEGASPQSIDKTLTDFGFAMGPCAVGDLAGLDVGWRARKQAGRVAPVADALCERGRFGQKTGGGYYRYAEGSRVPVPDPEVDALIGEIAGAKGVERRAIDGDEIFERLIFPMINEGARILDEGIATRASDIDLIWVNGYGWPAFEGGPMFLADRLGAKRIAAALETHAAKTGDDSLRPADRLVQMAETGSSFAA
jgi:3-hydroxyacyl-CoA dehydrogenase